MKNYNIERMRRAAGILAVAVFLACSGSFAVSSAIAADVYVKIGGTRGSGTSTPGDWSNANCYPNPIAGFPAMSAGDTMTIDDGDYNGAGSGLDSWMFQAGDLPPNGTGKANMTVVRARHIPCQEGYACNSPLKVTFGQEGVQNSGLDIEGDLAGTKQYIKFWGIRFRQATTYTGWDHLYFKQCGFEGTLSGNSAALSVDGKYNLVEDCVFYGMGRYKFVIYDDTRTTTPMYNVCRRCIARQDYANANNEATMPIATFNSYETSNSAYLNSIAIDGDSPAYWQAVPTEFGGAFYATETSTNVINKGSIAINTAMSGIGYGWNNNPVVNTVTDFAAVKTAGGIGLGYGSANRATLYDIGTDNFTYRSGQIGQLTFSNDGLDPWGADNPSTSTNLIMKNLQGVGVGDNYGTIGADHVNLFGAAAGGAVPTNLVGTDPSLNGLLYPVRIEAGSPLATAGTGGGQIGASILWRIGHDGDFWGDPGWDQEQPVSLWPWPYEDWVKAELAAMPATINGRAMPSPTRGVASPTAKGLDGVSQLTLTRYIWEALGNVIPDEIYNPVPDFTAPTVTSFTMPATAASLTVPISTFTATDNVGVSAYLVTESAVAPAAGDAGWSFLVPSSFTFAGSGTRTAYAWAKDNAGNVSAGVAATVDITPDNTLPNVTAFTMPASAKSLTVSVSSFTATDNVGVAGYLITQSSTAPAADAAGWTASAPTSFTFSGSGSRTAYAWVKDVNNNVSTSLSATVSIDTTVPTFSAFAMPSPSNSLTVPITTLTATDNVGVAAYLIKETSTTPSLSSTLWSTSLPASYTFSTSGNRTAYAWVKDAAGNISARRSAAVSIDTTLPTVTAFTMPASSSSLNVAISSFTGSDNVAVTGYLVTESATPPSPSAGAAAWSATAPTSYTFVASGDRTAYAWVKDAAGNVSANGQAAVTITLPDVTAPTVTAFTMPASANSHTVSVTTFTAGDDVGVTGYLITESSSAPAVGSAAWSATAPASFTFAGSGARTAYAWARDAAGHVSASASASVSVTVPDTTPPTVTAFTIPATANSSTVSVTTLTATDDVAVTGYLITESSTAPAAGAAGWSGTAPAGFTFAGTGARTAYAWAKDAAGNVSASAQGSITITPPDTTAPTVSSFTMPATASSVIVSVTAFTASDNVGVTGYLITESSTPPAAGAAGWGTPAPASFTFAGSGARTAYAWAKDAAGNVSAAAPASVTITLPDLTLPTVTGFTMPATATSLTVSVSSLTATDNVGVTGYLVTESSTAPASGAAGWSAGSPASFTFAGSGSRTAYAWAKDAAGNVSPSAQASVIITLPDTTAPTVTAFTMPATATALTASVSSLTATDNVGVTGYLITESSSAPAASATGWSAGTPASFVFAGAGARTAYAWAKDAAGNVSAAATASVAVTLPDTTAPTVTAFALPATATSFTVAVTSFTASDNIAVAGYLVTESSSAPAAGAAGWSATAPSSVAFAGSGTRTAYAWAKDAAGNVSVAAQASVTITLPDTTAPAVTAFGMPATATSLTVSVSSYTATDNVGVTGYLITESSSAPAAGASGWSATAPSSFTFAGEGSRSAYAWAKDAAGNVSAGSSAAVVITLPDTTAPTVSAFAMPATAASLTVSVTSLTASDNVGVTGYLVTESATPPAAGASGWSGTPPASFTFGGSGARTAHAWAKDAAGNVSAGSSAAVTITLPDLTAPIVTGFGIPATATSLTVSVTTLTATDNVGVTGYLVTESSSAPAPGAWGWSATAPASFVFAGSGTRTAYAWAKDAAGNVSASAQASVAITLPDTIAPTVTAFAMPASATALTVSVSSFTATDNVAVTGYLVTESSGAPAPGASGWSATAPASFTFAGSGNRTAYAWARDAAGNVSAAGSASVAITIDTTAPTVTAFTMPAGASSVTVSVSSFTATDGVGVTGYLVTESSSAPAASASGWSATVPASFTFSGTGARTAYAWAKDAAGNVSLSVSAPVTITLADLTAPTVTAFTMPATATSLTVSVSSFTATDNVGVTGYLVTESATAPAASASGWSATAPASFTFAGAGARTAYGWAKDAAGNVAAGVQAAVAITLPDTTAPTVTAFTMPATATSLTVSVSSFTATDNVGVTGYLVTESATAPAASASGWSATAPASFTFAVPGARTAYAWAKDAAGNVSAAAQAAVSITLPDTTAPNVTSFTMPATATSLTVSITAFTATDNVGVTGYLVTESATAPAAGASGWSASAPSGFAFAGAGARTAFAWAKDAAGNVSASASASVTITLPDTTAPTVTAFTMPASASSLTVSVSSFTATDAVGVTGYLITESATAPAASATGWSSSKPTSFTFAGSGSRTAHAWAKDAAGNVSAGAQASVVITLPDTTAPTVTAFALPATATSLTVSLSSLTATDNVGVTGYLVTESATAPAASATGWSPGAPVSFTFAGAGSRTAHAWAKDAAGNVSAGSQASVVITLPDTTAPTVTAFTMPATAASLTVSVSAFTATDGAGVTGYLVTESSSAPAASSSGWSVSAPANFTFAGAGSRTAYAWAKDAAGNVSAAATATVAITLPDTTAPTVTSFSMPGSASSLTVSVTSFTAVDNKAVTGYLITESPGAPQASAAGWSATAPAGYTFSGAGTRTAYAWAKDAAGNVSPSSYASVTITLPDLTAPTVTSFTMPAAAASLTVGITALAATDNVGVTGYLVTESASAPAASGPGWSPTPPASFTFAGAGNRTAYAWVKDAAGNVSASAPVPVAITLPDTTAPTVTAFALPATANSVVVPVSSLTATDNVAVAGYLITESASTPASTASGWTPAASASFTFAGEGSRTAYAWAKDAAGNVSAAASATVAITVPDTTAPLVTQFAMPGSAASLVVAVQHLSATDNVGVTGYRITESATAPSADDPAWSPAAPASFTFAGPGSRAAYAWAKDAAGNVSVAASATVSITLSDTTEPTVAAFTMPATAASLTVAVSSFAATDDVGVTGYLVTESSTPPSAGTAGWSATPPGTVTFSGAGPQTAYAWARDAAGNVSAGTSATVAITLPNTAPPVVDSFVVPSVSATRSVPVIAFTASGESGVAGYLVTESASTPSLTDTHWSSSAPTTFTLSGVGVKSVYGWVRDNAGRISAGFPATVATAGAKNISGQATLQDCLFARDAALGRVVPSAEERTRTDIAPLVQVGNRYVPDPDGKIDVRDVIILLKLMVNFTW